MTEFVIESHLLPISSELSHALAEVLVDESIGLGSDEFTQARALTFNFCDESYTAGKSVNSGFGMKAIKLKVCH